LLLPIGCRNIVTVARDPVHWPSFRWIDIAHIFFFNATVCWNASAAGHGLVQTDAALAATSVAVIPVAKASVRISPTDALV
jgi:hypothetical protein